MSTYALIAARLELIKSTSSFTSLLDAQFPHLQSESLLLEWISSFEQSAQKWDHIAQYIDHTVLKPVTTEQEIVKLCEEAASHNFYAVCVNGSRVEKAVELLKGKSVHVAAVCGFPLGSCTTATKAFEAENLSSLGATEIDMVINVGWLIDREYEKVVNDIKAVVQGAAKHNAIVKVILETGSLTKEQIVDGCILSVVAGAHFVKTSTGFGQGGATVSDVHLMKSVVGKNALVKASGGVRSFIDAVAMIKAGASRIGTSGGVAIVKDGKSTADY